MPTPSENIILQSGDLSRVDERRSGARKKRSEKSDMGIIAKYHENAALIDLIGLSIFF